MRRIRLVDSGEERIVAEVTGTTGERLAFDPAYAVRMVSDIVPNAWIAREIVGGLVDGRRLVHRSIGIADRRADAWSDLGRYGGIEHGSGERLERDPDGGAVFNSGQGG